VQNESDPILLGSVRVLKDHASVCVLRALIRVLATDEDKAHSSFVVICRS
jgi:hypothetical protein